MFCDADRSVSVTVSGAGELGGIGTGRARTEECLAGQFITTYDGRALAIVRPTGPGELIVTVTGEGLAPAHAHVRVHG